MQQGNLWKTSVAVFFPSVFGGGFVKAGQTKPGAMWLAASMNFDFFPLPFYLGASGENALQQNDYNYLIVRLTIVL